MPTEIISQENYFEEIILVSHLEKYLIEYFLAAAQNTHDKMKENTKGTKQQLR